MRAWYRCFSSTVKVDCIMTALFFVMGAVIFFVVYRGVPAYFVNDTGVEVVQVQCFKLWPFKTFIPTMPWANVEVIESFYGYYMAPFRALLGDNYYVFRIAQGIFFSFTAAAFYLLLRQLFAWPAAVFGALVYVTTAYSIWWALLLLRDAFSPFFVIGVLAGLIQVFKKKYLRGFMLTVAAAVSGVFVYTSLKAVLSLLIVAAVLVAIVQRRWKELSVFALIGLVALALILLAAWSTDSLYWMFDRGRRMQVSSEFMQNKTILNYLHAYIRTFLLPIYQKSGGFLIEPTHQIFERSIFPIGAMSVLWIIGLCGAIYQSIKKNTLAFFLVASALLSPVILCTAGPSLKTTLCIIPITITLIAFAFDGLVKVFYIKPHILTAISFFVLSINFAQEMHFMFYQIDKRILTNPEIAGQKTGQYLLDHDQDFDIVIHSVPGLELVNMLYPSWQKKTIGLSEEYLIGDYLQKAINENKLKRIWVIGYRDSIKFQELMHHHDMCFDKNITLYADLFRPCLNLKKTNK